MRKFRGMRHSDEAEDLLYEAWVVIANAHPNWDDPTETDPEWAAAARRWRDKWHKHMGTGAARLKMERPREKETKSRRSGTTMTTTSMFGSSRIEFPPPPDIRATVPMWTSETTTTYAAPKSEGVKEGSTELREYLRNAIARVSREALHGTQDSALADLLMRCLDAYEAAVKPEEKK